jgi:Outer membrane protein beta-barrel domain
MLNLSDKDLDRLSREAAQEHDPGDIIGPRSWDKLEVRLDRDLGRVSPNTPRAVRGIRRLPFYYAPAMLLLLGFTWYFVRQNKAPKGASSGSPPLTAIKTGPAATTNPSSSSQNPEQTDKSTSTSVNPSNTAAYPTSPDHSDHAGSATAPAAAGSPITPAAAGSPKAPATAGPAGSLAAAIRASATAGPAGSLAAAIRASATRSSATRSSDAPATGIAASNPSAIAHNSKTGRGYTTGKGHDRSHRGITQNLPGTLTPNLPGDNTSVLPGKNASTSQTSPAATTPAAAAPARELAFSPVRGPLPLKHSVSISDSALRAFNIKTSLVRVTPKKGGLHINRSLQLGLLLAPDFSSVNSVAGDKPGSTFGVTVDYQFAHHWYVGTGLLVSKKNYAANPQDYHVPPGYYGNVGLNNIDFVKGSFNMLEIPLNLRYDFSVTGNTLFFATVGASSYLRTSENCNYYFDWFGRQTSKGYQYSNQPGYLFSAIDLSVGVETGISNSLSLLIAPYMKIPSRNIGFGQVELSSVGINFALKFTPVLSRKR